MSKIINAIIVQAKDFAKETAIDIADDLKTSAKEKVKEIITNKAQNLLNKYDSKNIEVIAEESVKNDNQKIKISDDTDINNETKYMEILESKIVNGSISESSKYFLKLKRESLNISTNRAKELEKIVFNNIKC
jgi:hypothetical protein